MNISQFKNTFINEAIELLNKLDSSLLEFETTKEEKLYIEEVFRTMHTLKGISGMYGFEKIVEITHNLEHIFNSIREKSLNTDKDVFDVTLASIEHIRNLLSDEDLTLPNNIEQNNFILSCIHQIIERYEIKETKKNKFIFNTSKLNTWHIIFTPDNSIVSRNIKLINTFSDLFSLGQYKITPPNENEEIAFWSIFLVTEKSFDDIMDTLLFVEDYCKINLIADFNIFDTESMQSRDILLKELSNENTELFEDISKNSLIITETNKNKSVFTNYTSSKISVEIKKLDYLMNLVSEMVTAKSELLLSISNKNMNKIKEVGEKFDKLSKKFRDNALNIRLVSLHDLMIRFRKLVR